LCVAGLLGGPLSSIANAGVWCDLLRKLGYENVRECEDS
jgi:hypothetical protein